jgi:hypothetical protein
MEPHAEKNRKHAQQIVGYDVKHECPSFAFMQICNALICESGEGCKCSTKAGRHQQSPPIMFMVSGPGESIANDDASDYVYDQRPIGKAVMV